jgi:hypothetical protein
MKINLILDGHPLSGYKNIDPHGYGDEAKTVGDLENLHDIVEDAEATEILALDIIDFLPLNSVEPAISHWISKLRHGGKIAIGGKDLWQISKASYQKILGLAEANEVIHGTQERPRISHLTIDILIEILEKQGLQIIKKRINKFDMTVEAQRP